MGLTTPYNATFAVRRSGGEPFSRGGYRGRRRHRRRASPEHRYGRAVRLVPRAGPGNADRLREVHFLGGRQEHRAGVRRRKQSSLDLPFRWQDSFVRTGASTTSIYSHFCAM